MRKQKTTIGTMACLCCGQQLPVKQADNGTLSMACSWCDFAPYAIAGTPHHKIIMEKVALSTPPAPAPAPAAKRAPAPAPKAPPAPAPTPTAAPAPAAAKRTTIFG